MVASSFRKQIHKALRREVVLHEVETNAQLDKSVQRQLASHYYDRAVGHQRATVHPDFSNAQLEGAMNGLLADWSDLMESVGPCPTDDFIYNDRKHLKLPALMSWMARLFVFFPGFPFMNYTALLMRSNYDRAFLRNRRFKLQACSNGRFEVALAWDSRRQTSSPLDR